MTEALNAHDCEHEIVDAVYIDTSKIPRHVADGLSAALYKAVVDYHSDPSNVAAYEARKAKRLAVNA